MNISRTPCLVRRRRSTMIATAMLWLAACGTSEPPVEQTTEPPPVAPSQTPPAAPADPSASTALPPLTAEGWGAVRIGMTRDEVVAAAGEDANPEAVGGPEPDMCDEFRPLEAPRGLLVMVEQGVATRITLSSETGIVTEEGFGVGDPAARIKEAYGSAAEISPHKYSASPAEYITVWRTPSDGPDARGLVYEIGLDGRVQHIHAGGPSIQYVEGCL